MRKIKCSKEDVTEQDLPSTRRQVFADCYKEQFMVILRLGFLCLALILPAVLIVIMKDNFIIGATAELTEITQETLSPIYYAANLKYGFLSVLAFTLFFTLFSGAMRIIRQLVWRDPIFWKEDYISGMKNDSVRYAIISFLIAIINYLIGLLDGSVVTYILYGIFVGLILPVMIWSLLQTVYYKVGFFMGIRNSVLYYLKTLPLTLLMIIVTVLPFWIVTELIPINLVKYISLFVLALFYIIPIAMVWLLFACRYFDEFLNKEQYPSVYRKGLRPQTEAKEQDNDTNA